MMVRLSRWVEFVLLFLGVPLLIWMDADFIHPSILIIPVLVFVLLFLRKQNNFRWKELISWNISRLTLLRHGGIFLIVTLATLAYVYFVEREHLFDLPRNNPLAYLGLCLFYPVFSAYGQEIIYRTFLRKRYYAIFPTAIHFVLASALSFSFMHIVYYDPVSLILTLIGGLYFATVYVKTKSVLFVTLLHGIYGMMFFGLGMGRYFWLDMHAYF